MSKNDLSLKGKVALISGASSGLGEHFARTYAEAGASVVIAARRKDRLEKLVAEIEAQGGRALAVAMDVTVRDTVRKAFDEAEAAFGTPDVVVCNAGATGGQPFLEMEEERWDHVTNVNLKGVWNVAQEAAQRMVAAGKPGSIINTSSIIAFRSFPGLAHYGASKAAVNQLTCIMAQELAEHKIRVNAIAPGYFRTELIADYTESEAGKKDVAKLPLGRLGELEELDGIMLLLASDASTFMSGGIYNVDAGHSVRLG